MSHTLLGVQIAGFAILFLLGVGLVFKAYNGAGDALDLALDGLKYQWGIVCFWLILGLVGAGLSSGIITYGLSEYGEAEMRAKDCRYASSKRSASARAAR